MENIIEYKKEYRAREINAKRYTYKGESLILSEYASEISKDYNLDFNFVRGRIKRGYTLNEIINIPYDKTKPSKLENIRILTGLKMYLVDLDFNIIEKFNSSSDFRKYFKTNELCATITNRCERSTLLFGKYYICRVEDYDSKKEFVLNKRAKKEKESKATTRICNCCNTEKPLTDFRTEKHNGKITIKKTCAICVDTRDGIKHAGKLKELKLLEKQKLSRCGRCGEIHPLKKTKDNARISCPKCLKELHDEYIKKQKETLGNFYVKNYVKRKYGLFNKEIPEILIEIGRLELQIKNLNTYKFDNKDFSTIRKLSKYIASNYDIDSKTVQSRISYGYPIEICMLSHIEFKRYNNPNMGVLKKIKCIDLTNNTEFIVGNLDETSYFLNISKTVIKRCINTNEIRTPYLNSTNRNHFKFIYI